MASADTPSVTVAAGTLPQQPQEPPAVVIAEKVKHMLEACTKGDLATIRALTQEYPILTSQQDEGTGISPLMVASQIGNIELVQSLLNEGAPWNAVDRNGKCAGDYSTDAQRWDVVNLLVEWGTRSELILGTTQRMASSSSTTSTPTTSNQQQQQRQQPLEQQPSTKRDYLSHQLRYNADGTALLDQDNDAIMMAWERPIMKAHASVLLGEGEGTGGVRPRQHCRVMNVGFGMGIIDTEIQENYHPSLHIIIEAHPQVYQNMLNLQWDKKPNVQIYHGKWQDVLPKLLQDCDGGSSNNDSNNNNDNNGGGGLSSLDLDAIFYDTYAEHAMDMEDFHSFLPRLLSKRQGIYSFFNGLAPDNLFFHGVGKLNFIL